MELSKSAKSTRPLSAPVDRHSSRQLLTQELLSRGWMEQRTVVDRQAYVTLTSPQGRTWISSTAVVWYPFVSSTSKRVSMTKDLAYAYAQVLGVRVPATLALPAGAQETRAFFDAHSPVIVKPVDGHGGQGLTLGITQYAQLEPAIQTALGINSRALMQEQVTGEETRFTILDGEIVSVLLRRTPRVVGDGSSTVAELIAAENESRNNLQFDYLRYPQLSEKIVSLPVDMERVPASGKVLELSKSTMIRGGASVYNITETIHDSYKQTALRLAQDLGSEFLVVDMMIQDFAAPQTFTNYAFIEFNTAPSLRLYYSARDGKQYDIVKKLADKIAAEEKS